MFKPLFNYLFLSLFLLALSVNFLTAQELNLQKSNSEVLIDGTSNIHDWTIVSKDISGKFSKLEENEKSLKITSLQLNVPVNGLESGKKAMDKNTYKALIGDQCPLIRFTTTEITNISANGTTQNIKGMLEVAGKAKPIVVPVTITRTGSGITIEGNKKINMRNYDVEPPTALFGTITTGEEVTVKFKLIFQ